MESKYGTCPECGAPCEVVTKMDFDGNIPTVQYDEFNYHQHCQPGAVWVKATSKLPLHKAFWNIEDGFKKDCSFPARIDGSQYGMADLYDNRKDGAPDPIYYLVVKGDFGKEYYEDEFHKVEWLDESAAVREDAISKEVLDFIRDIAYNWDCDEDSHKYNTVCRKCSASELYYDLTKQQKEK